MSKKTKYVASLDIDYQMLDRKEIIDKRIIDFDLLQEKEGDTLVIMLEDGKQIEISLLLSGQIFIQSD